MYPVLIEKFTIGYKEINRNAIKHPNEAYAFILGNVVVEAIVLFFHLTFDFKCISFSEEYFKNMLEFMTRSIWTIIASSLSL